MIGLSLTDRQREILVALRERATADHQRNIDYVLSNSLKMNDIDIVCRIINDEYLMFGIEKNYDPNAYGRELEELLDKVNRLRLS